MQKLSVIRLYNVEGVPEHILEEVLSLMDKMTQVLDPVLKGENTSIILSAFNRLHAGMIVALITERGLKRAAQTEAIGLLKNVEHIAQMSLWEDPEDVH